MPMDYVVGRERLDRHTTDLLRAELVRPILPNQYLSDIPNHVTAFVDHLHGEEVAIDRRRQAFAGQPGTPIHLEKMGRLDQELVGMRLARRQDPRWLHVENETASEYMAYLACSLGHLPDLQLTALTDQRKRLSPLVGGDGRVYARLDALRLEVLREAFPAPSQPVNAEDIAHFKRDHGHRLGDFRHYVEAELVAIANIQDQDLREYRLKQTKIHIGEKTQEMAEVMTGHGWSDLVFGKICAVLGPIAGTIPSLVNAVYQSVWGGAPQGDLAPLAYAAYAQKRLHLG
ncbi:MAG: hypothetical protein MI757_21140 [Pirellulales bacterium]|nr:hypothetical protein [Pirellulales bacterium]